MKLTGGKPGNVTSLRLLNLYREEFADVFPPKYFPTWYQGVTDTKFFDVYTKNVSPGISEEIVYVVAVNNGEIISEGSLPICQIPKGAYIGRYRISYETGRYGQVENGQYICDYWVEADNISLIEDRDTEGRRMLTFATLQQDMLPAPLRESLDVDEKTFFDTWLI